MRVANEAQRSMREKVAEMERAKEEKLIAQFLERCKEDDRKEALARKVRAEAVERYKLEVAEQRDIKQAMYAQQKLEEVVAMEKAAKAEEFRKVVIAEARRKLLEEHASKLRGFLPRGVITSNDDLDILKAFDANKDGVLSDAEMDLAQAAFRAYDPGAAALGAPSAAAAGGARAPVPPLPIAEAGARAPSSRANASSVSFGGENWDDKSARQRK